MFVIVWAIPLSEGVIIRRFVVLPGEKAFHQEILTLNQSKFFLSLLITNINSFCQFIMCLCRTGSMFTDGF